jgi:hypothetical protein
VVRLCRFRVPQRRPRAGLLPPERAAAPPFFPRPLERDRERGIVGVRRSHRLSCCRRRLRRRRRRPRRHDPGVRRVRGRLPDAAAGGAVAGPRRGQVRKEVGPRGEPLPHGNSDLRSRVPPHLRAGRVVGDRAARLGEAPAGVERGGTAHGEPRLHPRAVPPPPLGVVRELRHGQRKRRVAAGEPRGVRAPVLPVSGPARELGVEGESRHSPAFP